MIVKVDISNSYDIVNWLFLRMVMLQVGFDAHFVNWAISCVTSVSFVVLINGFASNFFRPRRRLRQGFSLAPLLFIMEVEGLSRHILHLKRRGSRKGLSFGGVLHITHLFLLMTFYSFKRVLGENFLFYRSF